MILGLKNTILAVVITSLLGWGYSQVQFRKGIELGKQQQIALQAEVDSKVQDAEDRLKIAVAEGLKQIQIKNTTINNKAVKEIQRETVYKECKLPEEGTKVLQDALKPRGEPK
jgi:preprotein translocase subunit SecF